MVANQVGFNGYNVWAIFQMKILIFGGIFKAQILIQKGSLEE